MAASTRQRAVAQASMQATRLHRQLGLDLTKPVDVFGIAQTLGLWLMAQPLDRLYGCYLRTGQAAGIIVNSQHPESLQRFTVAHEIGHHILGHDHTTDDGADFGSFTGGVLEEAQAQAFAASLLLPLPLINRVLRELPSGQPLGPAEVYLFSRQTGVSYTAAVWTLQNQRRLSPQSARLFAKRGAAAAKTELRGRSWTQDARADVWMLGPSQSGLHVVCRIGDELHVRLPENLSTGHAWRVNTPDAGGLLFAETAPPPIAWNGDTLATAHDRTPSTPIGDRVDADGLELEADAHLAYDGSSLGDDQQVSGNERGDDLFDLLDDPPAEDESPDPSLDWAIQPEQTGTRALVFVPRRQGSYDIRLTLRPLWDPTADPVADFSVGIRARPRARIEGRGLVQPTREAWIRQQAITG